MTSKEGRSMPDCNMVRNLGDRENGSLPRIKPRKKKLTKAPPTSWNEKTKGGIGKEEKSEYCGEAGYFAGKPRNNNVPGP